MKINKSEGFTLIEVLVSLSIVSIIGLAFFSTINTSINTNKKNETDIKAMHLAQSEIENLRIQIKELHSNEYKIYNLADDDEIDINKSESTSEYNLEGYKVLIKVIKKDDLLYEIRVTVFELNSNFSNKETNIITQVIKGKG